MPDTPSKEANDRRFMELIGLMQSAKPTLTGVWYNGQNLKIDGYKFVSCRFDKCMLHIDSTEFEFERCFISDDTTIYYGSSAIRPIRLFLARLGVDQAFPAFVPTRHSDGTISIS